MSVKKYKFDIYSLLMALLCAVHLTLNIVWLNLNKLPFSWDEAGHTIIAFRFTDFFKVQTPENFLSISDYYPPFVHLLVSFFMLIFGKQVIIGPLVVSGFFILAIIFLYLYTAKLFQNKLTGLLAAIIFSFLPNMYALSRGFLLEMPLLAMVLGCLFFLEKSDNFRSRKHTIFAAIFLALALAVKWNAVIFLFIPIAAKLFKSFPTFAWKNLSLVFGIVLAVNLPWYTHNLPVILHATQFTTTPEAADPQKIISFENFKFYLFLITNFQLTWFGMIIFLISAVYFYIKKRHYLLLTYLFVYLILSLIGNKDLRYVTFLAPVAAIIIAFFLSSLKRNLAVVALAIVLICYFVFYYLSLSFGLLVSPKQADFRRSIEIPVFGWIDLVNLGKDTSLYLASTYDRTVWPNSLIAQELSRHNPARNIKILVISEKPYFNQVNMELARRQLGLNKIRFFAPYQLPPFSDDKLLEKYLLGFDVILAANKDLGSEGGIRNFAVLKQISGYLEENKASLLLRNKSANLVKINNYFLPDGDKLDVYKPKEDSI